jgi:hypothetical protein
LKTIQLQKEKIKHETKHMNRGGALPDDDRNRRTDVQNHFSTAAVKAAT